MFEAFQQASQPRRPAGTGWIASLLVHGALLGGFAFSARTPVITERAWPLPVSHDPIYQPVRLVKASELEPARVAAGEPTSRSVVDILPPRRKSRAAGALPAPQAEAPLAPPTSAQDELLRLAEQSAASVQSAPPAGPPEPLAALDTRGSELPETWATVANESAWPAKSETSLAAVAPSAFKMAQLPDRIDMIQAAYYRTYDTFPSLPGGVWPSGKRRYALDAEVCVSARGEVSRVIVRDSTTPGLDRYVVSAIQSWRYRPRVVAGSALPFCHPIRIVYARS